MCSVKQYRPTADFTMYHVCHTVTGGHWGVAYLCTGPLERWQAYWNMVKCWSMQYDLISASVTSVDILSWLVVVYRAHVMSGKRAWYGAMLLTEAGTQMPKYIDHRQQCVMQTACSRKDRCIKLTDITWKPTSHWIVHTTLSRTKQLTENCVHAGFQRTSPKITKFSIWDSHAFDMLFP
jgi:hypothetical protein